jgi:hypothetical protein
MSLLEWIAFREAARIDDRLVTVPLGFIDILKVSGFDPTLRTKLLRHQDRRYDIRELRRHNWLEIYQGYQKERSSELLILRMQG